jgi:hypothetical protein
MNETEAELAKINTHIMDVKSARDAVHHLWSNGYLDDFDAARILENILAIQLDTI